jgi:hypothetical protein
MKISERLARLDADREKIATQLADLETAERVLMRVSKAPTWSATKIGFGCRSKGRDYPAPRAATAKSAGRERSAQNLGLAGQRPSELRSRSDRPRSCWTIRWSVW